MARRDWTHSHNENAKITITIFTNYLQWKDQHALSHYWGISKYYSACNMFYNVNEDNNNSELWIFTLKVSLQLFFVSKEE